MALAGVAGIVFFWITDPRWGLIRGPAGSVVDRANDSLPGTVVGLLGSLIVFLIGLYLATRRKPA